MFKHKTYKKIRIFLVFFSLAILLCCQTTTKKPAYKLLQNEDYVIGLSFEGNGSETNYSVHLKGNLNPMLGKMTSSKGNIVFKPVIPFTKGEQYEVQKNNKIYFSFEVQMDKLKRNTKLIAMYPTTDTVPENLLKMYFEFEAPMQQSQSSLHFIKAFNLTTNKEVSVFLPLENELWNREKTRLTLWLDPGRIKKDLIPNKEKGIPIVEGHSYKIVISSSFENSKGAYLDKDYEKTFYVTKRDTQKPIVSTFQITTPKSLTKKGLQINFKEHLDFFLLKETIQIYLNDTKVEGKMLISINASSLEFIPKLTWKKGNYTIRFESRLEDLAGNNLNRLFDHDLRNKKSNQSLEYHSVNFTIE